MGFISFHLSPFSGQICTLLPAQTHKGFPERKALYFITFAFSDCLTFSALALCPQLLMQPFIGWSATVVITLGRSRMGSSCPLLSSPTGNDPAFRSWRCSLAPMREVLARPSARLSQGACCLKKLFGCQGTPCRRGQTVTGSGAGRTFRLGSPSIYNGHFFSKKQGVYL